MKYNMTRKYYCDNLVTPIIFVGAFVYNFVKNIFPFLTTPLTSGALLVIILSSFILFLTIVLFPYTVLGFENLFFKFINREIFESNKFITFLMRYYIITIFMVAIKIFYLPLAIIIGLPVAVIELNSYFRKRKLF